MKFPLFIDLEGKSVLVVGGGKVAVRRINTLLKFGAYIKVVSPAIYREKIEGDVVHIKRNFEKADIDGVFMVVGATGDRKVNHLIYTLCKDKNIFCSIADCKEECNFYFPAVCLNDKLSVGLVSDGNNHALVKNTAEKIRGIIEDD